MCIIFAIMATKKKYTQKVTLVTKSTLATKLSERGFSKRPKLSEIQREALKIELCKFLQRKGFTIYKEVLFRQLFETERDYRADFYIIKGETKIFIEINGGQNVKGRHTSAGISGSSFSAGYRITNYENDLVKLNLAQINGFFVLQYTYEMLYFLQYEKDFNKL
jgi:hypothetical protein